MPSATRIVERDHRVVDANPFIKINMELKDFMGDLVNPLFHSLHLNRFKGSTDQELAKTLSCKCSKGGDVNSAIMAMFQTLSNYSWEVKMVLAFAAFAVVYGESSLMADQTDPLAESVKLLYSSINALIKVTNTIVEIGDSQSAGNIETVDVDLFELTKKVDEMNKQLANGEWMKPTRDFIFDVNAIRSTHVYNGKIEIVELKTLHKFINEILDGLVDQLKSFRSSSEDCLKKLTETVQKICEKLLCKCSRGGDENSKTVALFKMLSHYSWEAKMVLTLASFAVIYGESSLMAKRTNSLLFKIQSLINVIVKVTKRITRSSVIICTSHVIGLDDEYTDDELLKLRNKIDGMNTQIGQELDTWRQSFETEAKRKADEADAKRIVDEADAKRKADEVDAKRIADEAAEAKREADEAAEAKRVADEVEAKRIADEAATMKQIEEVAHELRLKGLKSSNLIIGIDFCGSNEYDGPTCYAPIIEAAIDIVEKSGGQHHVLVIIADDWIQYDLEKDSIVTAR
ncbi:hypothetical protein NE237_001192 [Protea cynaroides]|uniref:Sieve element occlusion N-terminal domain-containing protein n=1 Tax=Protea cynaroides TaxID=273540 RepID=A0A9Q0KTP0_9MAGN|nr:hypothetical protein NE237_001192 [Protea cynaroides]